MLPAIGYAFREPTCSTQTDPLLTAMEFAAAPEADPPPSVNSATHHEFAFVSIFAPLLSPGSAHPPESSYLDSVANLAVETGAESISAALGGLATNGEESQVRASVPCTQQALDNCACQIDRLRDRFAPCTFYIENLAPLKPNGGEMCDADFWYRLLRKTGCGWQLNLSNVYASAENFTFDPYAFIAGVLPAAGRVQLHLAGIGRHNGAGAWFLQASRPIPPPVWSLYRHALRLGSDRVSAVFVERESALADDSCKRCEALQARKIAEAIDAERLCFGRG